MSDIQKRPDTQVQTQIFYPVQIVLCSEENSILTVF